MEMIEKLPPPLNTQKDAEQLYIGNENASAISASTGYSLALTITHNAGSPMLVTGFHLVYLDNTLDRVPVIINDAQRNRQIVTGNSPLCTIGVRRGQTVVAPFQKIKPFILYSGQSVQLSVLNNTGGNIAIGALSLTLYGFQ